MESKQGSSKLSVSNWLGCPPAVPQLLSCKTNQATLQPLCGTQHTSPKPVTFLKSTLVHACQQLRVQNGLHWAGFPLYLAMADGFPKDHIALG